MKTQVFSGIRGACFFAGAMLTLNSCEAVDIFTLGHYEHKWTPTENFQVVMLASVIVMGIASALFVAPTVLFSRRTQQSWGWSVVLGASYALGLFLLGQILPGTLNSEGVLSGIRSWAYLLGTPLLLGLLVSRRTGLEEGG